MEKLLLVTGRLAEADVRDAARSVKADVLVLPVDIALFIGPKMAVSGIEKLKKKYARVIFPGMTHFDVSQVEKEIKMPCFKGPQHASDIARVLKTKIKLSKTEPADLIIERDSEKELAFFKNRAEGSMPSFLIGGVKIGPNMPSRILAEIVDAPLLKDAQILERARYYLENGADMIDVGAIASDENEKRLSQIIRLIKAKFKVPLSIDSINPKEINAAIDAGADLVLSLCLENMKKVKISNKVAYVVIPDSKNSLETNVKLARKLGFKNLIADPILHPPFRVAESLSAYYSLHKHDKKMPLMMGVSNVAELMDIDSIGINGLLAALATELNVSLVLITENSNKTRNSVKEMRRALDLCFLAKSKGALPKDLGINLLLAKSKTGGELLDLTKGNVITVSEDRGFISDPKGHFKISVDFRENTILAAHYNKTGAGCDTVFKGKTAEAISKKIIKSGLVSSLEHASYLGRELQRAETYLKLKKSFIQDEEFAGL